MTFTGFSVALGASRGFVRVNWNANPEANISGYRVHYGKASGKLPWSQLTNSKPSATLVGLKPGTYFLAVQAFNTSGLEGPLSSEVSFTVPENKLAEISVESLFGSVLIDGQSTVEMGSEHVGSTRLPRTFTIKNVGKANLTDLAVTSTGGEFSVSALATSSLAPGASTHFAITFTPTSAGARSATIRIASNDADENPFDIALVGFAISIPHLSVTHLTGSVHLAATLDSGPAKRPLIPGKSPPITNGIEVIDGRKYRTLTITKTSGSPALPRDVEVSSNLVDWSSGRNHTTVLINTATTLKVRDSTPVTLDAKRYIRLKPDAS